MTDVVLPPLPAPPPSDGGNTFIGVPNDYQATVRQPPYIDRMMEVAPRYMSGAELVFASQPTEVIAEQQIAMAAAGLLTGKVKFGIWDDKSITAYRKVLAYANQNGVDDTAALQMLAAAPSVDIDGAGGGNSVAARLPKDPEAVRQEIRATAIEALGRDIDNAELDFLVSQFQALESQDINQEIGMAQQAAASPFTFDGDDEVVPDDESDFDATARFTAFFEDRYGAELDRNQRVKERAANSENLGQSLLSMNNLVAGG